MNDALRYPGHRTPSLMAWLVLWLVFIVAIAAGAWLILPMADTGTAPDQLAAVDAVVSVPGEVDPSAMGFANPDGTPALQRASARRP